MKKFEELTIGDTLGPLDLVVTKEQCRTYAKVSGFGDVAGRFTGDEAGTEEGLPGIILPGNMSLGLMSKLVTDWIGPSNARLIRMGTTYRVPVQPDHKLVLNGFLTNTRPTRPTAQNA